MALMANTPPFRKLPRAATTTLPLGANVTARSSSAGGFSSSVPTHFAPREVASRRCDAPRVDTYTSQFHARRTEMARCAEAPNPNNPTRSPVRTPGTAKYMYLLAAHRTVGWRL